MDGLVVGYGASVAEVYDVFWKRWKSIGARVELMKRIVNDAPDIDTLREDEEAMANHLYALMHVCLPNELQHDAAKALARYRVQGDEGRAIIEAVCKQINAVFKEEDLGRVKLLYKVTIIITRFINPNATRLPRVNGAVNTESPSSSGIVTFDSSCNPNAALLYDAVFSRSRPRLLVILTVDNKQSKVPKSSLFQKQSRRPRV
ncbi:hypothetical protein B0H10DRAFT_1955207 [Mycena sp. CBHHK59/15]|nr:hypothetical protein B0H10DRAFT_1955207 [Mycena sp. CBHHK59/15]